MTNDAKRLRAQKVYDKTSKVASNNAWAQGLSGVVGMGANWLVDIAVLPLYIALWNDIRDVYGKGEITVKAATSYLRPNLNFLVQDFVWDKAIGSVPIVGIPFNVAFAKALSWRLGAWFGLLSALADVNVQDEILTMATMQLVREVFPSMGSVFSFEAPNKDKFINIIASLDGLTRAEAEQRIDKALRALSGE